MELSRRTQQRQKVIVKLRKLNGNTNSANTIQRIGMWNWSNCEKILVALWRIPDQINMFAMYEEKNGQGVRSLLYRRQNSEVMVTCNYEKICNYWIQQMPDFEPKICHEVRGRVSTFLTLPAVVMTFWHLVINFAKICVVLFRRGSKTKNLKSQRLRKTGEPIKLKIYIHTPVHWKLWSPEHRSERSRETMLRNEKRIPVRWVLPTNLILSIGSLSFS